MQHVLDTVKFKRVSSIRATLKATDDIVLWSQKVHNLPLAFVTPLKAQKNVYTHY